MVPLRRTLQRVRQGLSIHRTYLMKYFCLLSMWIASIFACHNAAAQATPPYEIGTWKNFSKAAVSYTWDDNTSKQLTVAKPLFDEFDFKVTFFTSMRWSVPWTGLKQAAANGHEVASHSMTHTPFNELSDAQEEEELKDSQVEINENIGNTDCITFAYSNCVVGNKSIVSKYYISARGCNGAIEQKTPADFMNVGSIVCGPEGSVSTSAQFNAKVDQAVTGSGWVVFLLHGIDNDGGWSPVVSAELKTHLQYVNNNRDKFWVDTYGNVVRYIKERNALLVKEISANDSVIVVEATHNLDQDIYNIPVSIRRPMPAGWSEAFAVQNGIDLEANVVREGNTNYLVFDVVPNAGEVMLSRSKSAVVTDVETLASSSLLDVFPNPSDAKTTIRFSLSGKGNVSLDILDESGRRVQKVVSGVYEPGTHEAEFDSGSLSGNVFYCVLSVDGRMQIRKVLQLK